MKARIITIGDEILIGQIIDTNSAWIASKLNDIGISIESTRSIGDSECVIIDSIKSSIRDVDITIITGGLGPTKDDITKYALSKVFSSKLVRDDNTYQFLKEMLNSRGVEFNELNQSQAMVPAGCIVLPNKNGTAPCMWFERGDRVVISLPGVPFEMKALMVDLVIPRLMKRFKFNSIIHKTAMTFGLAESILATVISDWESNLDASLHLAYLPNPSGIRLRLSAYSVEHKVATEAIDRAFNELESIIPHYFIGYGEVTVADVVAKILTDKGATLSIAESCTGGALSGYFTSRSGASKYFTGSVVSYSNEIKHNVLGVHNETLKEYGAVSEQVAIEMSEGVRDLCGTDYSISTTGIAGPDGGSVDKPVGTVWISISSSSGTVTKKMTFGSLREQNIIRSSVAAINLLRLTLLNIDSTPTTEGVL